jgi:Recombination endonuclease VII
MNTFVERYGHVKYRAGLVKATGPCEIPGCDTGKTREHVCRLRWYLKRPECWTETFSIYLPSYFVDHCHKHGYIRGFVCGSCNNLMREFDRKGYVVNEYDITSGFIVLSDYAEFRALSITRQLAFNTYAMNCPGCANNEPATENEVFDVDHLSKSRLGEKIMRHYRRHTGLTAFIILLAVISLLVLEELIHLAGLATILGGIFIGGYLLGSRYPLARFRKPYRPHVIEASSYEPYSPGHADTSRSRDDLVSTPFSGVHDLR